MEASGLAREAYAALQAGITPVADQGEGIKYQEKVLNGM
jgi:hypothetical protein